MKSSTFRTDLLWALAALVLLALLPALTSSRVLLDYVIRLAAMGIFATSLNILIGYGGLVSFGHAMFFGGGAYAFAVGGDHLAEACLLHGCAALVEGGDVGDVDVDADDIEAAVGEGGRHAAAELAESDD